MPYFIEQGCDGKPEYWAVKDVEGEAYGCHATKQDAIDQGVAISLAEDVEFLGENKPEDRAVDGEPIVICDIDDTLIHAGERIDRVWDFVESQPGALFIVTGRPESTRGETEAELENLDIEYQRLIMNSGSTADSAEFKKLTAESLLETYNVVLAVENDADTLEAYRGLGVEAIDPADIPEPVDVEMVDAEDDAPVMGERFAKLGQYTVKGDGVKTFESRVSAVEFELRDTGDGMTFEGYAAVFNSPSEPLPFIERIAPGAFTRSLKARNDIKLLWNHDSGIILGSTRAKTLTLVEDEKGLKVRASLPNTSAGRDAAELLKRGDVNAMSFGFTVPPKGDVWNSDGTERTLRAVSLHEVSIVAWPAYTATAGTASVRSFVKTAQRAQVDADALAEALVKLEAGDDITADDRTLLTTVIDKLAPVEAAEEQVGDMARLALKRKKLELLKGFSA